MFKPIRPMGLLIVICCVSTLTIADDKKDLYDKGTAATATGDVFSARDAFCELSGKDKKYKDAAAQCQTYQDLTYRTLIRYKVNYAEGMQALQNGDFSTAEMRFRNVKRGEFADQAKERLATIGKWKVQYPPFAPKTEQGPPAIHFGPATISLGMTQNEIDKELLGAARHLSMSGDKTKATIVLDKDESNEGEIRFDKGEAFYVLRRTPTKTSEELARELAQAVASIGEDACRLQNQAIGDSGSDSFGLIMFCGPYSLGVITLRSSGTATTALDLQIGSTDPKSPMVQKATVLGTVFNRFGAPMPGVVILIENKDTGFIKTATTGADGAFTIARVPAANGYKISAATADGNQIGTSRENINIPPGEEKEIVPPLREPPLASTSSHERTPK